MEDWELLGGVEIGDQPAEWGVPGDPGKVREGALVSHEILGAVLLEMGVDNTKDSTNLVSIALFGRRNLLRVISAKPGLLTEIRALTGHLEVQPLQLLVLLRKGRVRESRIFIVRLNEILKNSPGLCGKPPLLID